MAKSSKDCTYITPCGWCKRKNEPCKEFEKEENQKEDLRKKNEIPIKAPWE